MLFKTHYYLGFMYKSMLEQFEGYVTRWFDVNFMPLLKNQQTKLIFHHILLCWKNDKSWILISLINFN